MLPYSDVVWFASSPATCMDVSVHVAPGTELDAFVRVQTGFSIFCFQVFHYSGVFLACEYHLSGVFH